tara:strand:- start:304 stop:804 length:501 start_codon:yes stop_codon:yes gene_type:complete
MLTVTNPKKTNFKDMPLVECLEGNAMDTYFTLKLYELFNSGKMEDGHDLYHKLVAPVAEHFVGAEHRGIDINVGELDGLGRKLKAKTLDVEDQIYESNSVLPTDNLKSNADMSRILFARKTNSGYEEQENSFNLLPTELTATEQGSVSEPSLKLLLEMINKELLNR